MKLFYCEDQGNRLLFYILGIKVYKKNKDYLSFSRKIQNRINKTKKDGRWILEAEMLDMILDDEDW